MPGKENDPSKVDLSEQNAEIDRLIAEYTQAISADPKNALSYRARGVQYGRKMEYTKSIQDFDKALELSPDDARSFGLRGVALQRIGEYQRAVKDFGQAAQLDPAHSEIYKKHQEEALLAELDRIDTPSERENKDSSRSLNLAFNLLMNPFVILGVEPTASAQNIKYACEDAIDDQVASVQELQRAQQVLLTPRLRLDAELSGFPDVPPATVTDIVARLKRGLRAESVDSLVADLHSLPRSNVLAHVGASLPLTVDQLIELLDAQETIAIGSVAEAINDSRESAGFAKVDRDAVEAALEKLEEQQIKAVVECLVDSPNSTPTFGEFLSCALNEANPAKITLLDRYVRAYGVAVASEMSRRCDKVAEACGVIRNQPGNSESVENLSKALHAWNEIARPLQSFEFHMSREEPQAKELYHTVRNLYLWLANEKSEYRTAKLIAKTCADVFDLLPRSIEQMREEEKTLVRLESQEQAVSQLEPLSAICEKAQQDHRGLEKALLENGFGPTSRGIARSLYAEFRKAALATKGTEIEDIPWRMVRDIAISLNNDSQSPKAANAITAGLIRFLSNVKPSESLVETLKADELAVQKNIVQKDMEGHMRAGRLTQAIEAVGRLISLETDTSALGELRILQDALYSKRRSRNRGRWIWAAVAAVVVIMIAANQNNDQTNYSTPASYTPTPTASGQSSNSSGSYRSNPGHQYSPPANSPAKRRASSRPRVERPPKGTGLHFTQANIRYCLYKAVILNSARNEIRTKTQELAFNADVDDWNSRCSNYRYRRSDKQVVDAELPTKRAALEKIGRSFMAIWANPPDFKKSGLAIDTSHGERRLTVDLAINRKEWDWGTSFRTSMPSNSGVLYIYPSAKKVANTMATAYFPLDVLFIGKNRKIDQIFEQRQPKSTNVIVSRKPEIAMLELNGGTVVRLGIKVGDLVHTFKLTDGTSFDR